jgi:hypothetical protein
MHGVDPFDSCDEDKMVMARVLKSFLFAQARCLKQWLELECTSDPNLWFGIGSHFWRRSGLTYSPLGVIR